MTAAVLNVSVVNLAPVSNALVVTSVILMILTVGLASLACQAQAVDVLKLFVNAHSVCHYRPRRQTARLLCDLCSVASLKVNRNVPPATSARFRLMLNMDCVAQWKVRREIKNH